MQHTVNSVGDTALVVVPDTATPYTDTIAVAFGPRLVLR